MAPKSAGVRLPGRPGQLEPVVEVLPRLRRRRPRQEVAQALDRWAQEALAERPLELDLVDREHLLSGDTAGAVHLQALLHHLGGVGLGRTRQAVDDQHHGQAHNHRDCEQHQLIPRWRPLAE
jgi:hypothetical protein